MIDLLRPRRERLRRRAAPGLSLAEQKLGTFGRNDRQASLHNPQPVPELPQGRKFGEAEKPEGIAVLRLAF